MPLDPIARRYAETLLTNATAELDQKLQKDLAKVRDERPPFPQGMPQDLYERLLSNYITAHAEAYLEQIRLLTQARMDSLTKAYEKSGLPFDESAFNEIKTEVIEFCHQKQHNAVGAIGQIMSQTFHGSQPEGLQRAAIERIIRGVDGIMAQESRDLSAKRDEVLLDEMRNRKAYAAGLGKRWDVFVCHATEDKDEFVRPLAEALEASGLLVWYDEFTMTIGDSLRRKIEEGLSNSRYGIVVLSENFFAKKWPQDELDGLASKEVAGTKVILPVWHDIGLGEVQRQAPMLSGRLAAKSSDGVPKVVRQLRDAMGLVQGDVSPEASGSKGKAPDASGLPALRPKIVPLRFGRTPDNRYGLFVRNDGEPAFDISMDEPVALGTAKLKFWERTYPGLTNGDGELFIESVLEMSSRNALTADALRDQMIKAGLDKLALRIRYRDLDNRDWVTNFDIVRELWDHGLRVGSIKQELI